MMPTSTLRASQGQALTALLHTLRPDWDLAGIRAALRKAAEIGTAADLAVAATRCAANPDMRTPALIAEPGQHWQGTLTGAKQAPLMCPDHPRWKAAHCPECVQSAVPRPPSLVTPRPRKRVFIPESEAS